MCKKCQELETKIARYRRILARFENDDRLSTGIARLIEKAEAELAAVHHEREG